VQAAQHHFDAGDVARSTSLFDGRSLGPPGRDRARILFLSGSHGWMDLRRVRELCERALIEAEGDDDLLAEAHEHLAWVAIYRGDLPTASQHASAFVEYGREITSPAKRAEHLATFGMIEFLMGRPAEAVMSEADRLRPRDEESVSRRPSTSARTNHGLQPLGPASWMPREDPPAGIGAYEQRGRYLVRDEVSAT
jgi:hypothetical protein